MEETPSMRPVVEQTHTRAFPVQLLCDSKSGSDGKSCLCMIVSVAANINGVCKTGLLGQGV